MEQTHWKQKIAAALAAVLCLAGCGAVSSTPAPEETVVAEAPLPTPSPRPTPTPEPVPVYTGPDLPEREKTDDSFFADAAFFGNSLVEGLRMCGGLKEGEFYSATSASVVSVGMTKNMQLSSGSSATLLQALCEKPHGKIYTMLGINEIGFEPDYFIELYSAMLDEIRAASPDAEIYIMSLTPVTEKKSESNETFSMERVRAYNEALRTLAETRELYFVDLEEALAGEDGYLPADTSSDGVHLKPDGYAQWADYLRTHYAVQEYGYK